MDGERAVYESNIVVGISALVLADGDGVSACILARFPDDVDIQPIRANHIAAGDSPLQGSAVPVGRGSILCRDGDGPSGDGKVIGCGGYRVVLGCGKGSLHRIVTGLGGNGIGIGAVVSALDLILIGYIVGAVGGRNHGCIGRIAIGPIRNADGSGAVCRIDGDGEAAGYIVVIGGGSLPVDGVGAAVGDRRLGNIFAALTHPIGEGNLRAVNGFAGSGHLQLLSLTGVVEVSLVVYNAYILQVGGVDGDLLGEAAGIVVNTGDGEVILSSLGQIGLIPLGGVVLTLGELVAADTLCFCAIVHCRIKCIAIIYIRYAQGEGLGDIRGEDLILAGQNISGRCIDRGRYGGCAYIVVIVEAELIQLAAGPVIGESDGCAANGILGIKDVFALIRSQSCRGNMTAVILAGFLQHIGGVFFDLVPQCMPGCRSICEGGIITVAACAAIFTGLIVYCRSGTGSSRFQIVVSYGLLCIAVGPRFTGYLLVPDIAFTIECHSCRIIPYNILPAVFSRCSRSKLPVDSSCHSRVSVLRKEACGRCCSVPGPLRTAHGETSNRERRAPSILLII